MSLFSFGGSRGTQRSQSTSFDSSQSGSTSGGFSQSASTQGIAFEDVFARLFGGASGAAAGLDPSMLTQAANTLFSSGTGFLDSLGGGPGTDYLTDRLSGDNAVLENQIGLFSEDLGDFYNEQINPQITSQAVAGGQLGGGRQGVAQGLAAQAVTDEFRRGATALRAGDITARDQVAQGLTQNRINAAGVGLNGLMGLGGLADMGFGAGLEPYARLAAILGSPTVLTQAGSTAGDFAQAFSQSYGRSQATSEGENRSLRLGFFGE